MELRLYNGKWDGIWDKPKYQRIREKIWKAFEGIEFIEETHQYFYQGKELIPTSNICHLFRHPFDEDYMAESCAIKYSGLEGHKYYGMTKEEIIDSWHQNSKRATDHGTLMHLFGENCAYFMMRQYDRLTDDFKSRIVKDDDGREYIVPKEPKEEAIVHFWNDLPVSIIPIVFEIQMFSLKYNVSGTADLLFLHDPHIEQEDNDEEIMNRLYLMDYKGLPLDTPILTANKGWKTMETIKVGDIVYDKNMDKVNVLHTSEIHYNPCYKIKFDSGQSIIADCEHKWEVSFISYNNNLENVVMTTKEIYEYLLDNDKIKETPFIRVHNRSYLTTNVYIKDEGYWYYFEAINSIKETDTVPTRCIEVDGETHTYLCSNNLLVTHNTNADLYKYYNNMLEPFEELPDNDLGGYKIQAAIYSGFLMSIGFNFVARALIWLKEDGTYEKVKMESLTQILRDYLETHPIPQLIQEREKH